MKIKRIIPFRCTPTSWALKGKMKLQAEAAYYWEGDELERELALLDTDNEVERKVINIGSKFKAGTIAKNEHDKLVADLKEEPWVAVPDLDIDPEHPNQGAFELDWNKYHIMMLQENGYTGKNDEDIINTWFNDVCKTVLVQEQADQDYGLEDTEERLDVIRTTNPKPGTESEDEAS